MEKLILNNGVEMPAVGLGTFSARPEETQNAVDAALKAGYRMIDTAKMYKNEALIGETLKSCGISRSELFITTKIYETSRSYALTLQAIDDSLEKLQTDYIDLLLLHMPYEESLEMYGAMEEACRAGKVRAIGVANFTASRYLDFIKHCGTVPAVDQFETHVFRQNSDLQDTLRSYGTMMAAWSPLAKGKFGVFNDEALLSIAAKHHKSVAQVMLRSLVQRGIPVIPKSANPMRIAENFGLFDFNLDGEDMKTIASLDRDQSVVDWTKDL